MSVTPSKVNALLCRWHLQYMEKISITICGDGGCGTLQQTFSLFLGIFPHRDSVPCFRVSRRRDRDLIRSGHRQIVHHPAAGPWSMGARVGCPDPLQYLQLLANWPVADTIQPSVFSPPDLPPDSSF
jgi:hypothetical protein